MSPAREFTSPSGILLPFLLAFIEPDPIPIPNDTPEKTYKGSNSLIAPPPPPHPFPFLPNHLLSTYHGLGPVLSGKCEAGPASVVVFFSLPATKGGK